MGTNSIGSLDSRWNTGLLGPRVRGELVGGRLGTFVTPIATAESAEASDLDWVRHHNERVRESVWGSANLAQRLKGDSGESEEEERPPERVVKGEAFMVKMLEQRSRRAKQPD